MRSLLFAVLFIAAMGSAAHGASLSVIPDKTTYFIGETVTLTVIGDDQGASAYGVFGRLDYSGVLFDNGTRSQITLNGGIPWLKGQLLAGDDGVTAFSYAFNQIAGLNAQTAINLPGNIATITLLATWIGVATVNWHTALDGTELDFFGLTNAPGTSFTIIDCDGDSRCPTAPEPTTGALLALGLFALTAGRPIRARRPVHA